MFSEPRFAGDLAAPAGQGVVRGGGAARPGTTSPTATAAAAARSGGGVAGVAVR